MFRMMTGPSHFVFLLLLLTLLCNLIWCATIQLFEGTSFTGKSLNYEMDYKNRSCINLPQDWTRNVSSVNVGSLCIMAYRGHNCEGKDPVFFYPGCNSEDLGLWEFDASLNSLQVCEEHIEETKGDNQRVIKVDYKSSDGETFRRYWTINSCKTFPKHLEEFPVKRIKTYKRCYLVYETMNCEGEAQNSDNVSYPTTKIKSIEHCPLQNSTIPENITYADGDEYVKSPSNTIEPFAILTISILAAILVFVAFWVRKKIKSQSNIISELKQTNEKFIQEFINGNPNAFQLISYDQADAVYRATNAPYDSNTFEIPLNQLTMDQTLLGTGEFGMVVKAKLESPKYPGPFDVAVKVVKTGVETEVVKSLLDECKIMMYLNSSGKHEHIVNLVGACTENLNKLEAYVVIEYCNNGSMDKYLRLKREDFENLLIGNQLLSSPNYQNFNDDFNGDKINTHHLLTWSIEVADGMAYLASKKVIHGDLAVRNVLLDHRYKAKISDFGFSRRMYQYSQYVKTQQAPLPWKWMAIESLEDMTFSTQTDVWAFGVTIWEIFTLARTPYPGVNWNTRFVKSLKDGLRLPKPKYAPLKVFEVMLKCWEKKPIDRPSFEEIAFLLSNSWGNQKDVDE